MAESLIAERQRFKELLGSVGRSALYGLFPNDFEVYIISLELANSKDQTIDFFSFPVNPTSISINEPELTSINKTFGGITTLKTNKFIPKEIQIQGNFGRNFKVLLRNKVVTFNSLFSTRKGRFKKEEKITTPQFSNIIKTGYGSTKILQGILNKSTALDSFGKPMRLYFYNFAFNESYLVEVINSNYTQNRQTNLIWGYNIQLKAIAPINSTSKSRSSLRSILISSNLQKGANVLASTITNTLL